MNLQQLPLGFILRDDATFANYFVDANNRQVFTAIQQTVHGIGDSFLYIWGAEGSGRSHLLQASCHAVESSVYLPLSELPLRSGIFDGLHNISLLCIDDVEQISGNAVLEEELFHLFNKVRANNNRLIIAANLPPNQLSIKLPDLKSRLSWGVVYQLHSLEDDEKIQVLQTRAQARGLDLDQAVGKFLLRRCPRNMAQMFQMLDQLDQASLTEQRRLTIPFVKEVLGF